MTVREETKRAVLAQIITVMEAADAQGVDPWMAAEGVYPTVPTDVIAEAWCQFEAAKTDAWWRSMEQTIDGEIVKRALKAPGGAA
ncbi:hypothetical protein [Methylopila sp. 73B]|uniref:hypothetical protein n=1 Tax=Methylopila sp. 73B TaxID=1120792 RepID=UPI0003764945|nr:hypothetical protein [Methylopila sp. 73B]